MSNFPCPTALVCDCAPTPFRNFSSEAPDPFNFFAFAFFFNDPPLNSPSTNFTVPIGVGGCYSVDSQVDANDCALRNAQDDAWIPWRNPTGGRVPIFSNQEQTCNFPCPGGAPDFVFTIAAGTLQAHSQAEADAIAASLCQYRGQLVINCTNPVTPPSIDLADFINLWDLAPNAAFLVGQTRVGSRAGWFNNGGMTVLTPLNIGTAFGVNNNGDVGGDFDVGINQDAFWYDGVIRDLGFGVSGTAVLHGMSSDGFSVFQDGSTSFLYNPIASTFTSLGFLGGGASNQPGAPIVSGSAITQRKVINSSHQICGVAQDAINDRHAYRWSGALVDITPAAGLPNPFAGGLCIDDTGAVLGTYQVTATTTIRGFLNLGGGPANSIDIGGVGILKVDPCSMSDQNQIICGVCNDGTALDRAFRWNSVDGFQLIDRIAGAQAFPQMDCNSHGDIVGGDANNVGWLYRNGVVYQLIDILNAWGTDPDWTAIQTAELCNDNRQIAGFGVHLGLVRAYLCTIPDGAELGPPP